MGRAFLSLPIALRAAVLLMQKLCCLLVTNRRLLPRPLSSKRPCLLHVHCRRASGSFTIVFLRSAPDLWCIPHRVSIANLLLSLFIVFRESPQALLSFEISLWPNARGSFVAMRCWPCSSRSKLLSERFSPKRNTLFIHENSISRPQ